MKCVKCSTSIPEGRLKAIPNTKVCTPCSTENAYYANQVVRNDEDYTEMEFIKDPQAIEELNRLRKVTSGHLVGRPD